MAVPKIFDTADMNQFTNNSLGSDQSVDIGFSEHPLLKLLRDLRFIKLFEAHENRIIGLSIYHIHVDVKRCIKVFRGKVYNINGYLMNHF